MNNGTDAASLGGNGGRGSNAGKPANGNPANGNAAPRRAVSPVATGSATTTTPNGSDDDPPPDHTLAVDLEYTQAVQTYWDAARTLTRLIDRHRPDRWTPLPDPASDDQWCRHHLETIGQCESRFKGDECRMCNELRRTYGHLPDADLMRTRHQLGYLPGRAVHDWLQRLPRARKRKARKAS